MKNKESDFSVESIKNWNDVSVSWEDKMVYLVFSEQFYDKAVEEFGENCGFDKSRVTVIRGYPKFD